MSKIILLVGPTAVGKTKISIELAKYYNAEIINADSTGVYKEPLIGTAKITPKEMDGIKHHMLDLISLKDEYTIYDYQKEGRKIIDKLINENKNIIITGGSGLYIKALLYDYDLKETKVKRIDYSNYSNEELKVMADKIDINNNIHINNRQRLERYITYYKETGNTIKKTDNINKPLYEFKSIGLKTDREILYDRCNRRVDIMFKDGLLEEAKELFKLNCKNFSNLIGYKELELYFKNIISLDEAKELIKKNTRHYAKRQFTWFNNQMKEIEWFTVDYNDINNTIKQIKEYLKLKGDF